jgi:hypothetical protein
MYEPSFCSECGAEITDKRRSLWAGSQFCDSCGARFRRMRLVMPLLIGSFVLGGGFALGRYLRPPEPPLIIQRSALSTLSDAPMTMAATTGAPTQNADGRQRTADGSTIEAVDYTCGARTKKGTPCLRRVHGPVRCWQHLGKPAILPQDSLMIK